MVADAWSRPVFSWTPPHLQPPASGRGRAGASLAAAARALTLGPTGRAARPRHPPTAGRKGADHRFEPARASPIAVHPCHAGVGHVIPDADRRRVDPRRRPGGSCPPTPHAPARQRPPLTPYAGPAPDVDVAQLRPARADVRRPRRLRRARPRSPPRPSARRRSPTSRSSSGRHRRRRTTGAAGHDALPELPRPAPRGPGSGVAPVCAQLHTGPERRAGRRATALTGCASPPARSWPRSTAAPPTTLGATVEIAGPDQSTRRRMDCSIPGADAEGE